MIGSVIVSASSWLAMLVSRSSSMVGGVEKRREVTKSVDASIRKAADDCVVDWKRTRSAAVVAGCPLADRRAADNHGFVESLMSSPSSRNTMTSMSVPLGGGMNVPVCISQAIRDGACRTWLPRRAVGSRSRIADPRAFKMPLAPRSPT